MKIEVEKEWWKKIFDDLYLCTDARSVCDDDLTRQEVDFLVHHLPIHSTDPILDLCGGHGRHAAELSRRGFSRITLLDYSAHLLKCGQQRAFDEALEVFFVRGDARQTGLNGEQFRYVFMLGSSFGYFVDEHENCRVLREAFRLLSPGGFLLLDLPFRKHVEKSFQPIVHHTVDEQMAVTRHRLLQDGVIYACEQIALNDGEIIRENRYCTRLYHPSAIARLLKKAGFENIDVESDYMDRSGQGDFGAMTNRMVVTAQK